MYSLTLRTYIDLKINKCIILRSLELSKVARRNTLILLTVSTYHQNLAYLIIQIVSFLDPRSMPWQ